MDSKPSFQLNLSTEEKTALLNMIHSAVKAEGLNVAQNAVVLAQKISTAPDVNAAPAKTT